MKKHVFEAFLKFKKWKSTFLTRFQVFKMKKHVFKAFSYLKNEKNSFLKFKKWKNTFLKRFSSLQKEKLVFEAFPYLQNEQHINIWSVFSSLQHGNYLFEAFFSFEKWKQIVRHIDQKRAVSFVNLKSVFFFSFFETKKLFKRWFPFCKLEKSHF